MWEAFLSLLSILNPKDNFQFACFIALLAYGMYLFREPLLVFAKGKKGVSDESLASLGAKIKEVGDKKFAPISLVSEFDRRMSKVETGQEDAGKALTEQKIQSALDRKDLQRIQSDFKELSIDLKGHLSQNNDVMRNQINIFEENTKGYGELRDTLNTAMIEILKKGNDS